MRNQKISIKIEMLLVIAFAIFFRICVSIILPYGAAPDEKAHLKYVFDVKKNWAVPQVTKERAENGNYEIYQAPLFYFLSASLVSPLKSERFSIVLLRCLSITMGVLTVIASYLIFPGQFSCKIGVASFFAFWPTYINISSTINNDCLSIFFCVVGTGLLLQNFQKEYFSVKDAVLVGTMFGLAVITKANAVMILFSIPSAWVVLKSKADKKQLFFLSMALFFPVMIIAGPWIIQNFIRYGNPSGGFSVLFPKGNINLDFSFIKWASTELLLSFWAVFGRTNDVDINFYVRLYGVFVVLVSIIITCYGLKVIENEERKEVLFAFIIILPSIFIILSHSYKAVQFQGRYFFVLSGLFVYIVVKSINKVCNKWRLGKVLVAGIIFSDIWIVFVDLMGKY